MPKSDRHEEERHPRQRARAPPRRCGAGRRPSRRPTGAAASSSARPPRAAAEPEQERQQVRVEELAGADERARGRRRARPTTPTMSDRWRRRVQAGGRCVGRVVHVISGLSRRSSAFVGGVEAGARSAAGTSRDRSPAGCAAAPGCRPRWPSGPRTGICCGVVGHRAEAVGDDVEEVARRRLAQPILVERRRLAVAAPHDHAVAVAGPAVARRAEDVEALVAARHDLGRSPANGKRVDGLAVDLAGVEQRVLAQVAAGDGARRPAGAPRAGPRRSRSSRSGLNFGWSCMSCRQPATSRPAARQHAATTASAGLSVQRRSPLAARGSRGTAASSAWSNFGSRDSMHRKNRSRLAMANRLALNTGWYGIGRPFRSDHAEHGRERREEDRRLEGRHDERRPAVERPAADVERVGDGRRPVLEAVARQRARSGRRRARCSGSFVSGRPSASCSSSIGNRRIRVHLPVARRRAPGWPRGRAPSGSRTPPSGRR